MYIFHTALSFAIVILSHFVHCPCMMNDVIDAVHYPTQQNAKSNLYFIWHILLEEEELLLLS